MNKLIVIHIDGFSYEYMNKGATPFLDSLSQRSICKRMAPSVFFQANLSSYTGKDASCHKRIVEYIYDPENSPFQAFKKFGNIMDNLDRCMPHFFRKYWRYGLSWFYSTLFHKSPVKLHFIPYGISPYFNFSFNDDYLKEDDIFAAAKKAGLRTAWDDEDFASNVKRRWMGTYFYRFYPGIMPEWGVEKIKEGRELIWVDLGAELDRCGHKYGPIPSRFSNILKKIDNDLKKLLAAARNSGYRFIVFSDHGMEPVKGAVDLNAALNAKGMINGKDYIAFYDSTLARFWTKNNDINKKIKKVVSNAEHGRLLEEKDSMQYGIPRNESIGDIVFAVDQGYLLLPNFYQGREMLKGMHGYLEDKQGPLDGIFVTDAGEVRETSDNRMKVIDIAGLALKTIGIK